MCICTPGIKTPWCGKPGCERPLPPAKPLPAPSIPTNLFAYTAPGGSYPEYISINRVDGKVQITVRSTAYNGVGGHPRPGEQAMVELPEAEWERMQREFRQRTGWFAAEVRQGDGWVSINPSDIRYFVGIDFASKCKRRRADGPTPCLCCPRECVG